MSQSYIKPLFEDAWDTFQLRMIQVGGNKRFFDFMKEYQKEREPIEKKYSSSAAVFYRKMLCDQAKGKPITEIPPARNATELAERTANQTATFFKDANEKYQIADKASELTEKTKLGIKSLWAKATGNE